MSSPDFQRYLINTLKLSVYGLLWGFPIPILLAFLLNRIESKKIKQKVQLVLYMPNFISVIVLCGIVRVLLSVTGPVNGLLHTSINFMTLPEAFRPIYIISGIWLATNKNVSPIMPHNLNPTQNPSEKLRQTISLTTASTRKKTPQRHVSLRQPSSSRLNQPYE